jgi:hypothetical protein
MVGGLIGWAIYRLYEASRKFLFEKNYIGELQNPYRRDDYAQYFAIYIALLFVVLLVVSIC